MEFRLNKGKGMIIRILNWCPTLEVRDFWGSTFVLSKLYTQDPLGENRKLWPCRFRLRVLTLTDLLVLEFVVAPSHVAQQVCSFPWHRIWINASSLPYLGSSSRRQSTLLREVNVPIRQATEQPNKSAITIWGLEKQIHRIWTLFSSVQIDISRVSAYVILAIVTCTHPIAQESQVPQVGNFLKYIWIPRLRLESKYSMIPTEFCQQK